MARVLTDPIADMLTRIRNAGSAKADHVDVPASKLKLQLGRILRREGYIRSCRLLGDGPKAVIRVQIRYGPDGKPVFRGLRRISKPGRRVYVDKDHIPRVLNDVGIAVLSTSQGLMTSIEARRKGIGGEVICFVW